MHASRVRDVKLYMILTRVSAAAAAAIDAELMSSGGFSLDQLMELAGQAVAHAVYQLQPATKGNPPPVLILAGPGNNGGDGMVAARHLKLMGYDPKLWCPKLASHPIFNQLDTQLNNLGIKRVKDEDLQHEFTVAELIVDAIFGFSFKPPVRGSFVPAIDALSQTKKPVLSVDVPSGWDVDNGPSGSSFMPSALISLTAPKLAANHFSGRHFIGGRFIGPEFAKRHQFDIPPFEGCSQVYEET